MEQTSPPPPSSVAPTISLRSNIWIILPIGAFAANTDS